MLLTNERIYNHTNSLLMSVIRYHVSLAFSSLPPDSSQRLDILLRGEDIYIYTPLHRGKTWWLWKWLIVPWGLFFGFPNLRITFTSTFIQTSNNTGIVKLRRRRLNNLEDKGKRRGMKTVSYFLLDFLANRFKEIPTRGVENFIFHRNCSDQTNSDQFPILKKKGTISTPLIRK